MSLYMKQIEQLVALQKVDGEIFIIRQDMDNAPKEVESIRAEFQQIDSQRSRHLEKLDHLKDQAKRLDLDIDSDSTKIKNSKNKLMQVANAKEYHAMVREMDSLEKDNRSREEERMALIEEVERQNSALEELKERYESIKTDLDAKEGSLQERLGENEKVLATLGKSREKSGKEVPAPVLSRYEFIRQRLAYPVIVPVHEGICSGCHISIPPQGYIELQKGTQILSCPNCQRLIYWDQHFVETE